MLQFEVWGHVRGHYKKKTKQKQKLSCGDYMKYFFIERLSNTRRCLGPKDSMQVLEEIKHIYNYAVQQTPVWCVIWTKDLALKP